jgi:8-oxo-dGTP pyrophosphatase MutT (NUDIX family)
MILQIAAKALLINKQGKLLILRESASHDTNTQAGHWQLPGGRVEPGESFFEGLSREVLEETGLCCEIGKPILVGEWHPVITGQIIGVFMQASVTSGKARLSDEHDELCWIDPKDWADYDIIVPDKDAAARYAEELLKA